MANDKLGIRQRRMLTDMARHGQGRWPQGWRLSWADRKTLDSLRERKLVTGSGPESVLTTGGRTQAFALMRETGRWHRTPCLCRVDRPTGWVVEYRCGVDANE